MTDPVELALKLVGRDRELGQQRERIQLLAKDRRAARHAEPEVRASY